MVVPRWILRLICLLMLAGPTIPTLFFNAPAWEVGFEARDGAAAYTDREKAIARIGAMFDQCAATPRS